MSIGVGAGESVGAGAAAFTGATTPFDAGELPFVPAPSEPPRAISAARAIMMRFTCRPALSNKNAKAGALPPSPFEGIVTEVPARTDPHGAGRADPFPRPE